MSAQPRPVFVAYLPRWADAVDLQLAANQLRGDMPDYHAFVTTGDHEEGLKFEAFYPDKLNEVDFEAFQKRVIDNIAKQPQCGGDRQGLNADELTVNSS